MTDEETDNLEGQEPLDAVAAERLRILRERCCRGGFWEIAWSSFVGRATPFHITKMREEWEMISV